MACDCETSICKEIFYNPCNTSTNIRVTATNSGTYTGYVEFNNTWKYFTVEVTEGQSIYMLSSLLNENYTHRLKLYDSGGVLTCYSLRTQYAINMDDGGGGEIIPPGTWQWATMGIDSTTDIVTSLYFLNPVAPILWIDSNPLNWANAGIEHDTETGTLDFSAIGGISGTLNFQYQTQD